MNDRRPSAFAIDHGTATTAAALIAHVDGRARILAASAQPAGAPLEPLLASLAADVHAVAAESLERMAAWQDIERLESATRQPPTMLILVLRAGCRRACLGSETTGWRVRGRSSAEANRVVAISEALLDPDLETLLIGASDPPTVSERGPLADLLSSRPRSADPIGPRSSCPVAPSRRPSASRGLPWSSHRPRRRSTMSPAVRCATCSPAWLRRTTLGTRPRWPTAAPPWHVPRQPQRGCSTAGSSSSMSARRPDAHPGRPVWRPGQVVRVDAALARARRSAMTPSPTGARWSTIRADPATLRDRVRNLVVAPWRDAAGDGARLRLAAGRAALAHLDDGWRLPASADGRQADYTADLLIVSGGAFAGAPAPAISLALVDTLRRPGAMALAHDHARILAPIGALENEEDRQRLLADLLEDALAPLGSAIVATGVHTGRHRGSLRRPTVLRAGRAVAGRAALDLPPGLVANAELTTRDGAWLGVRSHRVGRRRRRAGRPAGRYARDPLRLPDRPERRRDCSMRQRPLWSGPRRDRRGATAGDAHRSALRRSSSRSSGSVSASATGRSSRRA